MWGAGVTRVFLNHYQYDLSHCGSVFLFCCHLSSFWLLLLSDSTSICPALAGTLIALCCFFFHCELSSCFLLACCLLSYTVQLNYILCVCVWPMNLLTCVFFFFLFIFFNTRGPFCEHLRGSFRGESSKGGKQGKSLVGLSWALLWADSWATRGPTCGAIRGATRGSSFAFACSVRRPTSRLSFLLQNPRTPQGFQKGFRRVSEGVSEQRVTVST